MNDTLKKNLAASEEESTQISAARKEVLEPLVAYILDLQQSNEMVKLNFICTHNSRRSHIAQLLAAAASLQADLENIECYSGGTEVTQIHPNAKLALETFGFHFSGEELGENPHYLINLGEANMIEIFSKRYDDDTNPATGFAAVMVCSAASEACPFVPGAGKRFSITYEDPKEFDNDANPIDGYMGRIQQIAREMTYVMSQVSSRLNA
ncbi:MAG: protein-tyrosine-phosphatase [Cryomorphaceae bacterium]